MHVLGPSDSTMSVDLSVQHVCSKEVKIVHAGWLCGEKKKNSESSVHQQ